MTKKFVLTLIGIIAPIFLAVGCSNKSPSQSKAESQQESITTIEEASEATTTAVDTPYDLPHEITQLSVEVDSISDLLPLKHLMRHPVYLDGDDAMSDKQNFNISSVGTVYSMKAIRDKVILESGTEDDTVELGLFDPYSNSYETIEKLSYSAGYGNYSFVMNDRYYVSIYSSVNNAFKGKVIIYDIATNKLKTVDEFDAYNIVNGITAVGENAIAYFYYEDVTQDWVVKYYAFDSNESFDGNEPKEIFRHSNFNTNNTASVMTIGSDNNDIILVTQAIENDVYCTYLEWITYSGDWYKTEKINFDRLFGNEYEIKGITVLGEYYFVDALMQGSENTLSSALKRNEDKLNIFPLNTLEARGLLNKPFTDASKILYDDYSFSYNSEKDLNEVSGIDGFISVNLKARTMISYDFSTNLSFEDKVLINYSGDVIIFYCNNGKLSEYQIIKDYPSIDTKPIDGNIPVFPSESDITPTLNEDFFSERDFYYSIIGH